MNIRQAKKTDLTNIVELYRKSAETPNGIARKPQEISESYVADFLNSALSKGLIFVVEHPENAEKLIAEIHCYKFEPACFKHVLANLTIVVHPDFQGCGLGRKIFSHLLDEVKNYHPQIARIELFTRNNNPRGIGLYKSLGFKIEGICEKRILDADGNLGSDTMMAWLNPSFKI